MDNTPKISVTIQGIEGSTLVKSKEYEVIKWVLTKKDINPKQEFKGNEGNHIVKKGGIRNYPLIAKPAQLHINMTKDAYDYMTSTECPEWIRNPKDWKRMTTTQRLEAHLARTCMHYGGKDFSYVVLDD